MYHTLLHVQLKYFLSVLIVLSNLREEIPALFFVLHKTALLHKHVHVYQDIKSCVNNSNYIGCETYKLNYVRL